jgi:peptidoglycan LD-endopeptidase CwlK
MSHLGKKSKERLATCHPDLQSLFEKLGETENFSVLCGHRDRDAQEAAYLSGNSRALFGESPHNRLPSMAVDIAPYPIDWNDAGRFRDLAVKVKELSKKMGIPLTWGGDFKSFVDMPHFELTDWRKR